MLFVLMCTVWIDPFEHWPLSQKKERRYIVLIETYLICYYIYDKYFFTLLVYFN